MFPKDDPTTTTTKTQFLVVGLMVTAEFQRCQLLVTKLHAYYPDKYSKPQIRPMLNVDWTQHLLKLRRRHGGDLWKLSAPVAVFMDGRFLGDHATLAAYVYTTYTISFVEDFAAMGRAQVIDLFRQQIHLGRRYVTVTLRTDDRCLGTVLVMLYTDLVPHTGQHFLQRCRANTLTTARLVRVVKGSWLQFEGGHAPGLEFTSENYTVPHDRRGVVSLCSHRRRAFNTCDFVVSLAPAPWMDHKYVAFGLVVQGEEVLAALEDVAASREVPVHAVTVAATQEVDPDAPGPVELRPKGDKSAGDDGVQCPEESAESVLDEDRFRRGLYCMKEDVRDVSEKVLAYLKTLEAAEPVAEEMTPAASFAPTTTSSVVAMPSLDWTVVRSKGFLVWSKEAIEIGAAEGTREEEPEHLRFGG